MKKETIQLCTNCKTGVDTYTLDKHSPVCPHLDCHNGKTCAMYVPLEKSAHISKK